MGGVRHSRCKSAPADRRKRRRPAKYGRYRCQGNLVDAVVTPAYDHDLLAGFVVAVKVALLVRHQVVGVVAALTGVALIAIG